MKIRYDFVTNSSSTSYIIISDGEFNLKTFLEATGIDGSSPFVDIYQALFESFKHTMEPIRIAYNRDRYDYGTFAEWLTKKFTHGKEMLPKIQDAEKAGKQVYYGTLSSDRDQVETFFCTDSFIIDHPKVYVDAREYGW